MLEALESGRARPGLRLEAPPPRSGLQALPLEALQLGDAQARQGRPARLQLRLQGLPPRGARAGGDLRRAAPLHPGAGEPARLPRRRDRGHPPPAPPRRDEVRLGPFLQGAARPHHGALHHPLHAAAAAPVRRRRPGALRGRLHHQFLSRDPLVRRRRARQPAVAAARHPADADRHPGAHHRPARRDDHLQELREPRQLLDQGVRARPGSPGRCRERHGARSGGRLPARWAPQSGGGLGIGRRCALASAAASA